MSKALIFGIYAALALLLWMPLLIIPGIYYPAMVGKALFARTLIEFISVLWLFLALRDARFRPSRSRVTIVFAVYLAVIFLSAVTGVDPTHSIWSDFQRMTGVWDMLHWFMLVVVLTSVLRTEHAWSRLFNWNLVVVFVVSVLALAEAYAHLPIPYLEHAIRVDSTVGNPSYLAAILMVTIWIAIGHLAQSYAPVNDDSGKVEKESAPEALVHPSEEGPATGGTPASSPHPTKLWAWRVFWCASIVLGVWVLFLTGTRGALVAIVASGLIAPVAAVIWGNPRAIRATVAGAAGLLLLVAFFFTVDNTVGLSVESSATAKRLLNNSPDNTNLSVRVDLIGIGVQGFLGRPVLGWGYDNFASAYDRYAKPPEKQSLVKHQDRAHNQVVEVLSTTGTLGVLSYVALWSSLLWAIARRRRGPSASVFAYAILGGLTAYWGQSQFLFDTPTALLQWALVVAWVAHDEQLSIVRRDPMPHGKPSGAMALTRAGSLPAMVLSVAGVILLSVSLYFFQYRPLQAATLFNQALESQVSVEEKLTLAQESFQTFPALSSLPRRSVMRVLTSQWYSMSLEERQFAADFVFEETLNGLLVAPDDPRLISVALPILQTTAASAKELRDLDPLVQSLLERAPQRTTTYGRRAVQELLLGNYEEVIQIVDEFQALASWMPAQYEAVRRQAQEALMETPTTMQLKEGK